MPLATKFLNAGGAETGDLNSWAANAGTWAIDTSTFGSGIYSWKGSAGASNLTYTLTSPSALLADSGSQISFWFRNTTTPGGTITFVQIVDGSGNGIWTLGLKTNNTLANEPVGATLATGTAVLSANTWYRLSVSYYITNTTTYTFKVYVNGILDSTTNAGTLTRTGSDHFIFGPTPNGGVANSNKWFANIYVATGGASSGSQPDTGNVYCTAKRAFSNGTTNGFSTNGSGSGYGSGNASFVNNQPISSTSFVSKVGAGSATTEEYNVENTATGFANINGCNVIDYMGFIYASSLAGETASLILNGNTSNAVLSSTKTMFTAIAGSTTLPPQTGSDIGIITTTALTTVSLYSAGIVIAYKPLVNSDFWVNM